MVLAVYFVNYTKNISPDFNVFYQASERLFSGGNLYFPSGGLPPYNLPGIYVLMYPLTLIDITFASKIFALINIGLILLIWKLSLKLFKIIEVNKKLFLLMILIHFSTRSILNNGQLGLVYISLILLSYRYINSVKKRDNLTASILLAISFEIKPYLFILTFLWLILNKKFRILFYIFSVEISLLLFYFSLNNSANIILYLDSISNRIVSLETEPDQISIANILQRNFGVSLNWSLLIFTVQILYVLFNLIYKNLNSDLYSFMLFSASSVLISPYFHRQDSLLLGIAFCIFIVDGFDRNVNLQKLPRKGVFFAFLIISFASQTGGSNLYGIIFIQLLLLLFLYTKGFKFSIQIYTLVFTLIMNLSIYNVYIISWEKSYSIWTVLVYFSTLFTFVFLKIFVNQNRSKIAVK
jgi:hypothetical protein